MQIGLAVNGTDNLLAYYGHIVMSLTIQQERSPRFYSLGLISDHLLKLLFFLHLQ